MEEEIRAYFQNATKDVGIILALLSGLALLWKKVIKPMYTQAVAAQEMLRKIDLVIEQLKPNGGSSLRDAINRIESRQIIGEKRAKAYLLEASQGVWESDKEGKCIWWNRTLEKIIGREPIGNNWVSAITKEERGSVYKEWLTAIQEERDFYMTVNYQHFDGKIVKASVKAFPLTDEKNKIIGWYGIATLVP